MPTTASTPTTRTFRRSEDGFDVFGLRNEAVELALVPALGAKVISLRNLVTGYEWMWHPPTGMKLFRNHVGDDFATSTMTGWDEFCRPSHRAIGRDANCQITAKCGACRGRLIWKPSTTEL